MGQRLVVKVGTSTLLREGGGVNLREMDALARVLSDLKNMGHEIILVSSGAIGVGTVKLGLPKRPSELRRKQAAAAVGQCELMHLYDKFFGEYGQTVAQILLTDADVDDPHCREHLTGTFDAILDMGVIPVVNENDSVSSSEIETGQKKVLGDNDTSATLTASTTPIPIKTPLPSSSTGWRPLPRRSRPWAEAAGASGVPGAWRPSSRRPSGPCPMASTWSSPIPTSWTLFMILWGARTWGRVSFPNKEAFL